MAETEETIMTTEALDKTKPPPDTKPEAPSKERAMEIFRRAEKGDEECLSELRALLDNGTRWSWVIEFSGSPSNWLERRLIQETAGVNFVMKEAMEKKLANLRAELAGPSPSPLERLLVERAVLCWLVVHLYENRYAMSENLSIRQTEFHQRRIDQAHSRFLSAVKTLASVRKLAVPALQLNIGTNQVNVSG
jgi:hypothetical protein